VHTKLKEHNNDIKKASVSLWQDKILRDDVIDFYKDEYWFKYKLDKLNTDLKAKEMFIFGVNAGMRNAIKLAQSVVGAKVDGVIGKQTIKAINDFDNNKFDELFDKKEIAYYENIVKKHPDKKIFLRGWRKRAYLV